MIGCGDLNHSQGGIRVMKKLLAEKDDEAGTIFFVGLAGYLEDDWISINVKKI
jgi:hypothetical protein